MSITTLIKEYESTASNERIWAKGSSNSDDERHHIGMARAYENAVKILKGTKSLEDAISNLRIVTRFAHYESLDNDKPKKNRDIAFASAVSYEVIIDELEKEKKKVLRGKKTQVRKITRKTVRKTVRRA